MTTISGHHDDAHGHEHPEHLAHHWDSLPQQFEAGKLGMWLFLATEVLLFGGLFCAYSVWRGNHPELFKYGSHFLNTTLGATNTAVLILSSLTMAWGVTAAQQNKQGLLKLMLFLTLCGAATFLVIKYFEYKHKFEQGWFPGVRFYAVPERTPHSMFWEGPGEPRAIELVTPPAPNSAAAPAATEPNGAPGAPAAAPHGTTAPAATTSNSGGFELQTISVTPASGGGADAPPVEKPTFAPAAEGPTGLVHNPDLVTEPFRFEGRHQAAQVHPLNDPIRPVNAHMFFNIYFMMTGLHGIHVLVGMIVITWLLIRSFKGHFHSEYFTPVDLGGLYWHVVDLIWIFLFPLFYLI